MFLNHDITEEKLFNYIKAQTQPVLETTLLKEFFPFQENHFSTLNKTIVKQHFILYHYLYSLAVKLFNSNYILSVQSIYIHLFEKPEPQLCPYFYRDNQKFCNKAKEIDKKFCNIHQFEEEKLTKAKYLSLCGIEQYYLNKENYKLLDDEYVDIINKAEKIKDIAFHSKSLKTHFGNLNLDEDSSLAEVKTQYRKLVKDYHPDKTKDNFKLKQFYRIKESYEILSELMKT